MNYKYFSDKNILITGGTGSFGNALINFILKNGIKYKNLYILSRDENKQWLMKKSLINNGLFDETIRFILCDIRDFDNLDDIIRKKDINVIFHAAALKQVDNNEYFPMEVVKTNILGSENVRRAAINNKVESLLAISTDKAVKPINAMGMSKAMMEKIFLNQDNFNTKVVVVRYGNVINSRGSVIQAFFERIKNNLPLEITDKRMTRFLLRLEEAVELVFRAVTKGSNGDLYVRKMPACYITDLATAIIKGKGLQKYKINYVGLRPGEKINEVLVTEEEMLRSVETDDYFIIEPSVRKKAQGELREYASNTTKILSVEEIISLLKKDNVL